MKPYMRYFDAHCANSSQDTKLKKKNLLKTSIKRDSTKPARVQTQQWDIVT
jgi:hypothetical protein